MRQFLVLLVLLAMSGILHATTLGINEKQGAMVPLDLKFVNEEGESKTLKEYMDGKPTIISLNYFRCAGICSPQLEDMSQLFSRLELAENIDYKVLTISFNPEETPPLAAAKRKTQLNAMTRAYIPDAWHFLLTDGNSSKVLADTVGFSYEKTVSPAGVVDFIHPAALIVLSPEGKVTRYLNGINQNPFDVKMSILEAAEGKTGPTIAKTLLYCFSYDPKAKTYIFAWEKIAATVILVITLIFFIWLIRSGRKAQENQLNKRRDLHE